MTTTAHGFRRGRALLGVAVALATMASLVPLATRLGRTATAEAAALSATDESVIPHYFGPYPNWANSPQVTQNAVVAVSPPSDPAGVPAEATATVDPKDGAITGITVTVPGSGYTAAPTVTISAPGAHMEPFQTANAVATLATGAITSISVDTPGFGYTAPVVDFVGAGTAPVARASGGVDDLVLVDGGSGYQNQPIIEFSLPDLADGTQATGTAVMDATGAVSSVAIVDAGSGYLTAPTVRVLDGNADNPTGAVVRATIGVSRIDVVDPGAGFVTAPEVVISDSQGGTGFDATATATVASAGAVSDIAITVPGKGYLTPGLKKFVDTLPGLGKGAANNLGNYIPVAVPDTTTYPGTDYYEIGVVQYRQKFHSSLPATLLRGYVQLSTAVVPGDHVALENANLDPSAPGTPVTLPDGSQVYGVDTPHYLGPTIVATKNRPVRILFRNLLPTGSGGDLFLPVDTTLMGAGSGPGKDGQEVPGSMMLDPITKVPMDMAQDQKSVLDGVRNPMCGNSPKPAGCYSENRAELHLHGGITPWISDGTPHQWVTPGLESTIYPKGVSVSNVPDMADPGPGAETFFYTNQQSARLMFYHDHAWGITRLNVYAGEAAGYLITDDTEQRLFGAGGQFSDLGLGTPLVVQDKTFVPSDDQMAKVDPTWNKVRWGGEGSLWVPHVYMPAQNPGDPGGMSSFGRWMYGPWFWPPAKNTKYGPIPNPYYKSQPGTGPMGVDCDPNVQSFCEPQEIPGTPNITVGMEAFNDTPVVNGTAYPTTTVDPKSYRFRILNAANDRFWNLQWYVADPTTGTLSEVALKPSELAAAQTDPVVFPTPDTTKSPVGPNWIQIGTEGGFLPTPVVVPNQPTTWITDPTRFDVGNVDQHSLLLAPAERADVIVDFSQYRGKTLILYNDAPAAFPARVPGYDYYTGDPDMTPAGAPTTLPGYGPNTRTVMQVKVSSATPQAAFDKPNTTNDRMGQLMAAFAHHGDGSGVFESGQHAPIVGQAAYNTALGTSFVASGWCNSPTSPTAKCDGFARIQEQGGNHFKFDTVDTAAMASTTVAPASAGVVASSFDGRAVSPNTLAVATTTVGFGDSGKLTVETDVGTANFTYTGLVTDKAANGAVTGVRFTGVTFVSGIGSLVAGGFVHGPQGQLALPFEPKGIHDEMNSATFDEFGRMTANLGLEAPGATPLTQNIILYPYTNPATELLNADGLPSSLHVTPISSAADGTQIWKITHNGVDTHPIHFHLFDVQVINRVTWDNIIMPPEPTELGWKDTVRVSPLEDTIVAVRPIIPTLPFAIPDSRRPLNPMMPLGARGDQAGPNGSQAGFNNTDANGNPIDPIVNRIENFLWEYVFHCHILSHEEMDMMRPVNVRVSWLAPVQPALSQGTGDGVVLQWTDGTPVGTITKPSGAVELDLEHVDMKRSEIGFKVERAPVPAVGEPAVFEPIGTALANATTYTDLTGEPGQSYLYRVSAWNEQATVASNEITVLAPPRAPSGLAATVVAGPSVTLTWTPPNDATVTDIVVDSTDPDGVSTSVTLPRTAAGLPATWTDSGVAFGDHTYRVHAVSPAGPSADAGPLVVHVVPSITSLTADPSPSVYGSAVTLTATVTTPTPGVVADGTVTFHVAGNDVPVPLDGTGTATLTTSVLPVGGNTITATYSGSLVGSSASVVHTVLRAPTTTTLTASSPTSAPGEPVTFTATVAPAAATGSVTFTFDAGLATMATRTATVVDGVATYTTSLTEGAHTVYAGYGGDANFVGSTSDTVSQSVVAVATTTTVASNRNPSRVGESVTFTAQVRNAVDGTAVTAGVVTFRIGTTGAADVVQTVAVDVTGQATLTTAALVAGGHPVTAAYNATAPWGASTSAALVQVVNKVATATALRATPTPSVFGQSVTFIASVSPSSAGGTVTFTFDGTRVASANVDASGLARVALNNLAVGTHTVRAVYNGTAVYASSTSAVVTHVVGKAATNIALVSSASTARRGAKVVWTATVTAASPGVGVPTGRVRFTIDGVAVGDVLLNQAGRASIARTTLSVGRHTITATYLGSANFTASRRVSSTQRII